MEKKSLDSLIEEALANARADRDKIEDAYDKMKATLDPQEEKLFASDTAVKLLDQLSKNNDTIVKLAQIKEREASREKKEDTSDSKPFDIEDIQKAVEDAVKSN